MDTSPSLKEVCNQVVCTYLSSKREQTSWKTLMLGPASHAAMNSGVYKGKKKEKKK